MPVLIEEVVAEISESVVPDAVSDAAHQQMPLSLGEFEIARTLALIEQRRQRLVID